MQEEFLLCMKMRMAAILEDAGAAKDLLAVQHGLRRAAGTGHRALSHMPRILGLHVCLVSAC